MVARITHPASFYPKPACEHRSRELRMIAQPHTSCLCKRLSAVLGTNSQLTSITFLHAACRRAYGQPADTKLTASCVPVRDTRPNSSSVLLKLRVCVRVCTLPASRAQAHTRRLLMAAGCRGRALELCECPDASTATSALDAGAYVHRQIATDFWICVLTDARPRSTSCMQAHAPPWVTPAGWQGCSVVQSGQSCAVAAGLGARR